MRKKQKYILGAPFRLFASSAPASTPTKTSERSAAERWRALSRASSPAATRRHCWPAWGQERWPPASCWATALWLRRPRRSSILPGEPKHTFRLFCCPSPAAFCKNVAVFKLNLNVPDSRHCSCETEVDCRESKSPVLSTCPSTYTEEYFFFSQLLYFYSLYFNRNIRSFYSLQWTNMPVYFCV